jgi:penicillin-binding protein 1A
MDYGNVLKQTLYYCCCVVSLLAITFLGVCFYVFHNHSIDFARLERYSNGTPSILLDENGNEWARFQLDKRELIVLSDMPTHLIHAFISAEDWRFFEHCGISLRGVMRSLWVNFVQGRRVQGASTITQQLVRLLFFDTKKTVLRKIKEQVYALLAEQQFTKEHILQMYLNHIYFGCGIYGVEAASQRFWNKSARELTVDESATLAAVICSPNRYCPLLCPLSAERRRNLILNSMYKLGFISKEVCEASCQVSVCVVPKQHASCAPHLKELLRVQLEGLVGKKALYTQGFVIQTTINRSMQEIAEAAFKKQVSLLRAERHQPFDGGLLAVDTATGQIKAYVGGYDFVSSKFDRVFAAERQMGSIFKVLIYAAAIKAGRKFTDVEVDEPLSFRQANGTYWSPRNDARDFKGRMTLAYALSHSNNIIPIKLLLEIGINPVIDLALQCRLTKALQPYPSLALGCVDASLYSVTGMFNIFAHNGVYVEPHVLVWIKDAHGNKIWRKNVHEECILDIHTSGQVTKALTLTAHRLQKKYPKRRWPQTEIIVKTGTTNDFRTCWFVGSTPSLTTGVYMGCDDNRSMGKNTYPVHTGFPIWLDFNSQIAHIRSQFVYDPALQEAWIDERNGMILTDIWAPTAIQVMV